MRQIETQVKAETVERRIDLYLFVFFFTLIIIAALPAVARSEDSDMTKTVYDFSAVRLNGETQSLADYKGKVLLIVNTASKCGFTPQFEGLEKLYNEYKDRGFVVLGFPCNQFASQEPGTSQEIASFCKLNYGVTFPMFEKIDVNGESAHPLYKFLKGEQPGILSTEAIKWNFTKFLIGPDGRPVKRFSPQTKPEEIRDDIEKLLPAIR